MRLRRLAMGLSLAWSALMTGCTDEPADPNNVVSAPYADPGVDLGDIVTCAAPRATPEWVDRAREWGLDGPVAQANHYDGGGITLGDFDLDGDQDLILYYQDQHAQEYRWTGERFEMATLPPFGYGGTLFDYTGDGRYDLLVGGGGAVLLPAEGDGWGDAILNFAENMDELVLDGATIHDYSPGDLDGDGDLELYVVLNGHAREVGDPSLRDFVLGNTDGGAWSSVVDLPENSAGRAGFDAVWLDADMDGKLDVYVGNDTEHLTSGSLLFHNTGGGLEDWEEQCTCNIGPNVMAASAADMNDDGYEDIYVSANAGGEGLLLGQGDGSFVNVAFASGATLPVDPLTMDWGNLIADVDNDGLRDIVITQGDVWGWEQQENPVQQLPVTLFLHEPGDTYRDASADYGFPTTGSWRSVVQRDINGDGVVDILATQVADAPTWLVSTGCTENAWLDIDAPEGAWVEVEADGRWQRARATTDAGYHASTLPRVHVGLGSATRVDTLRVRLVTGETLEAGDFAPRRVVTVE